MPLNIDAINAAFPIAGQSNSTAGFRTNFAAIKTLISQLEQLIEGLDPVEFPTLATVATTGSYDDLTDLPTLFSGSYSDLTNKPLPANGAGALVNNGTGTLTWQPLETVYNGNYTVVNAAPINTEFSAAIITTATTATLAAPTAEELEGVEITLIKASANTVTTVVTVANAGWTGAGTVTLVEQGETARLINVDGNWYVTSLNGATVA
jgi:hypothetical protein